MQTSIACAVANLDEAIDAFGARYDKADDPAFLRQQWFYTAALLGKVGADTLENQATDREALVASLDKIEALDGLLPATD